MSNRTRDIGHVEREAAALLKATAAALVGADMDRVFDRMDGDGLAKGHAWRAIKTAIGSAPPVIWQRHAGHDAVCAMLLRAAHIASTTSPVPAI